MKSCELLNCITWVVGKRSVSMELWWGYDNVKTEVLRESCLSATLSITDPTWKVQRLNPAVWWHATKAYQK